MSNEMELASQVAYLESQLDALDVMIADLAIQVVHLELDRDTYRIGYTNALAAMSGIALWMRARDMTRSAEFVEQTVTEIHRLIEGEEQEQDKSE